MTNITLYEDTQKYINMFYTPVISSYEFLKSFFAELYQLGEHEVSRDLSEFFCDLKKNPKYNEVLYEIKFRSNGIFNYSNELEDNILMLQNMGLLGKTNPSFGIILINYNDIIAKETLDGLSEEHRDIIKEIAALYRTENQNDWDEILKKVLLRRKL